MKFIISQIAMAEDKPELNLLRVEEVLARHNDWRPQLAVFPRGYLFGGPPSNERVNLQEQKDIWEHFLKLSRKYPDIHLVSSALNVEGPFCGRETGFIVKNGRLLLTQPKISGSFIEPHPQWPTLNIGDQVVGLVIGPDLALPGMGRGANFIIYLDSAMYQGGAIEPEMMSIPPAGSWFIRVNACGGQGSNIFSGLSYARDPNGFWVNWAVEPFVPTDLLVDTEAPVTAGLPRKISALEALHRALVVGIRDFVNNAGFKKMVLGLSGGLDSAVCAVLAAEALGPENVLGLAMPSPYNAPESLADALLLAENLGIGFKVFPLNNLLHTTLESLTPHLNPDEPNGLMEENLQARLRGLILMAIANQDNRLLIATSNKSELAVGYATLYGDLCGALAPIGDIYKTRVYELANYFNHSGSIIPKRTLNRPPSAELRPDQTDQDSLPPYHILDDILNRYLDLGQSPREIILKTGYEAETVDFIISQNKKNAFKARQAPPKLNCRPEQFIKGLNRI